MTAIFNLSVNNDHRGRIFLSLDAEMNVVLDVVYPDEEKIRLQYRNPKHLIDALDNYLASKYEGADVRVEEADQATVDEFQRKFSASKEQILQHLGITK